MRTGAKEPLHRRNVMLTERTVQRLDSLRGKTEAMTDSEVLRSALTLYERVVDDILSGSKLQRVTPDGTIREIELLVSQPGGGP